MEEHEHDHEHGHAHSHETTEITDLDKLQKLISYMKDHNEHHLDEIGIMADSAGKLGKSEAAECLKKASELFAEGNELLDEALKKL